jgi:hypothetical protein
MPDAPTPAKVPCPSPKDIFCPPSGGDLTLQSGDGTEFLVHSVILKVASSVFNDMSVVGTAKGMVELFEDAETVSLMLGFIYPNKKSPIISSFDVISKCLRAAQKYDLEGMLETVDYQLCHDIDPKSLMRMDPLRVHQLALEFNLPQTKAAAAPLILPGKTDLCNPSRLAEYAKAHPSASLIRLVGIQGTRAKILSEVLFNFHKKPILPAQDNMFFDTSCKACQKWMEGCKESGARKGLPSQHPPSWLICWVVLVYQSLLAAPLDNSDHLFNAIIMEKFDKSSAVCRDCMNDFAKFRKIRTKFNEWANGVKAALKIQLASLEHLYSL